MPDQLVGIVVPLADVDHGGGGILFKNLVAAVLLGLGKSLIGVDFQKSRIKNLSGRIAGIVDIFIAGRDAARGGVRGVAARPEKWLHAVLRGGSVAGAPDCRFTILAVALAGGSGFDAEGLYVRRIIAGGDKSLIESRAACQQLGRLDFGLGRGCVWVGCMSAPTQRKNDKESSCHSRRRGVRPLAMQDSPRRAAK